LKPFEIGRTVQALKETGDIQLEVKGKGLKTADISIETK
jgi:hypothetical protein